MTTRTQWLVEIEDEKGHRHDLIFDGTERDMYTAVEDMRWYGWSVSRIVPAPRGESWVAPSRGAPRQARSG